MQEILPFIFYILFSSRLNCIITYKYRFRKYTRFLTEGFCQVPRIFSESFFFFFWHRSSLVVRNAFRHRKTRSLLLFTSFFPLLSNNIEYFFPVYLYEVAFYISNRTCRYLYCSPCKIWIKLAYLRFWSKKTEGLKVKMFSMIYSSHTFILYRKLKNENSIERINFLSRYFKPFLSDNFWDITLFFCIINVMWTHYVILNNI